MVEQNLFLLCWQDDRRPKYHPFLRWFVSGGELETCHCCFVPGLSEEHPKIRSMSPHVRAANLTDSPMPGSIKGSLCIQCSSDTSPSTGLAEDNMLPYCKETTKQYTWWSFTVNYIMLSVKNLFIIMSEQHSKARKAPSIELNWNRREWKNYTK